MYILIFKGSNENKTISAYTTGETWAFTSSVNFVIYLRMTLHIRTNYVLAYNLKKKKGTPSLPHQELLSSLRSRVANPVKLALQCNSGPLISNISNKQEMKVLLAKLCTIRHNRKKKQREREACNAPKWGRLAWILQSQWRTENFSPRKSIIYANVGSRGKSEVCKEKVRKW